MQTTHPRAPGSTDSKINVAGNLSVYKVSRVDDC
jgi:hypothetical protein